MPVTMRGATVRGFTTLGGSIPAMLFANGEQGAWYDPSDFSTLFQNSTGTTPVTAVEQPVRLMLDRSRGLVLGGELVTNGNFSDGTTGYTNFSSGTGSFVVASGVATLTGTDAANRGGVDFSVTTVIGRRYQIAYDAIQTSGTTNLWLGSTTAGASDLFFGPYTAPPKYFVATSTTTFFRFLTGGSGGAGTVDNISVRELPGNHALAPNDASRPVLRARYNLLTFSEQFDNAAWGKVNAIAIDTAATAGPYTTDAQRIRKTATTIQGIFQTTPTITTAHIESIWLKKDTVDYFSFSDGAAVVLTVDLNNGAITRNTGAFTNVTVTADNNGFYRVNYTRTSGMSALYMWPTDRANENNFTTISSTASAFIWGAQRLTSADQTATGGAYQRIAAATDYDTSNPVWRPYLAFDGSDDSLSTSSIDFSGTDEMTVFAGVTKLIDAGSGMLVELSATGANAGGFNFRAPDGALPTYSFGVTGTITSVAYVPTGYAAPITNVLSCVYDLGGALIADELKPRINGVLTQTGGLGSAAGGGNFLNAALFIGRRNNTNLPFNGRLTSLIVLGRTATAAEISATERWIASKTGVTL